MDKAGLYISRGFVDGAYWSLIFEFQFYFSLAAVYFFLSQRFFAELFASLTVVLVVLSSLGMNWIPEVSLYFPQFLIGIAFYKTTRGENRPAAVSFVAAAISISAMLLWQRNPHSMALTTQLGIASFLCCAILLGLGVLTKFEWKLAIPVRQLLVLYGIISYPLYLLHQDIGLVIIELHETLSTVVSRAIVVPAILTVIAYIVHRYI